MVLPIYLYGHPVLRKTASDIDVASHSLEELRSLIDDMYETMYHSDGIGLAAPQVGKSLRLFVVDAQPVAEDYPEVKGFKRTFVNAHVVAAEGAPLETSEGCLSLPGISEYVKRPSSLTLSYLDADLNPQQETFKGYAAVVVAHEYDHLDGKLFIDHLGALRKRILKGKLANIAKGNVSCKYRTVAAK